MARYKLFAVLLLSLVVAACTNAPKRKPIMALVEAESDVQSAFTYIDAGNAQAARIKINEAIAADPKTPYVWDALAYLEEATGSPDLAEAHYLKAIRISPQSGPAHNNYGTFLCHRERFDEAIHQFMLAIVEPNYYNPDSAYENAGLCALKAGKVDDAKNYFLSAIHINPHMPHSLFEMALISYQEKNYEHAQIFLDQYKQLVTKTGPLYAKLQAYLNRKHHPDIPAFLPEPLPSV